MYRGESMNDNRAGQDDVDVAVGPRELARRAQALVPGTYARLAKLGTIAFSGGVVEAALLVLVARVAVAAADEPHEISLQWGIDVTLSVREALLVAFLLLAAKFAVAILVASGSARMAAASLTDTRRSVVRAFLGAKWPVQASERQGDLQELMTTYADRSTTVTLSLAALVTAGLNVLTLVVIALVVDLVAAIAIVATGAGLALCLRPLATAGRRNAGRHADAGRSFANSMSQLVATAREVQIFGVRDRALRRVEELHQAQVRRYRRSRFLLLLSPQLYHASALLVLIAGIGVVSGTDTELESIGAVVLLLLRAFAYGQQAQSAYQALNDLVPYLDRVRQQRDRYLDNPARDGSIPIERIGRIELDNIHYEYLPGQPVLRGLSASIDRGEAVGVVGPSGSGKSTLLQILLRLREPTVGSLRADGIDVADLELGGWRRVVSFVPQDPKLVEGTVAENIAFYREVSRPAIEEAAAMASLTDEIAQLPDGFDTLIGPEDTTLSGGQQQRLTIARALVGQPELLVLDEPTSALDLVSEARIQQTLQSLHGKVTMVIVAHRLSTVSECDRIMVLSEGRVQGFDSHDRLLATSPFYKEILDLSVHTPAPSPS